MIITAMTKWVNALIKNSEARFMAVDVPSTGKQGGLMEAVPCFELQHMLFYCICCIVLVKLYLRGTGSRVSAAYVDLGATAESTTRQARSRGLSFQHPVEATDVPDLI